MIFKKSLIILQLNKMKKVVIAGGTGFIGSYLAIRFLQLGYNVVIISRQPGHTSWRPKHLIKALEDSDLVINLAGKSINCRHTKKNRQILIESRTNSTTWIGNAIKACENPPKLWINASASGVYQPSKFHAMTEERADFASDFVADLVLHWESIFLGFNLPETRQVALRTSVVLGRDKGALKQLAFLCRGGLGGKLGDGKQMFSWIHIEDYFRIVLFLLENPSIQGICNCTSPNPVMNEKLMKTLRKTLRIPFGIPTPRFAAIIGAAIIGTEPELLLNSSYLLPKILLDNGYEFLFPKIEETLSDLLN